MPIIKEIPYVDPVLLVSAVFHDKNIVFFDSALPHHNHSRYSFIAYDPFAMISYQNGHTKVNDIIIEEPPWQVLSSYLRTFSLPASAIPQFVGGLAGYIGYEFVNSLEPAIQLKKINDQRLPDFVLGAFDVVLVFDHHRQTATIHSSGFPETNQHLQRMRANARVKEVMRLLDQFSVASSTKMSTVGITPENVSCNVTYAEYCGGIDKVLMHIHAGDVYQANIAVRFQCHLPPTFTPWQLYLQLRQKNPAPFAVYLKLNDNVILSASPERFISVNQHEVITQPIKGTSARSQDALEDANLATTLYHCQKNRAENLMIVDLMRNDLSRVCELTSVHVPTLFEVQSYATVHHLVSTIRGKLKEECTLMDLLRATFPGGSITGAPKIKAIHIIDAIERHARGPYCGTIAYFGFDGNMDSSIVIRTFVIKNNLLTFHVGGGIVADSTPESEYLEILAKAKALYASLN